MASAYQSLEDEYMRQRAADVEDMGHRVLEALGIRRREISHLPQPGILVTEDLMVDGDGNDDGRRSDAHRCR